MRSLWVSDCERLFLAAKSPGFYPQSPRRGHAKPALQVDHVAHLDQPGAMVRWDYHWRPEYGWLFSHQKQGRELALGQRCRLLGHDRTMDRFGDLAWSVLLRP